MASIGTNFLTGLAGAGQGYLQSKSDAEQRLLDLRKQQLAEEANRMQAQRYAAQTEMERAHYAAADKAAADEVAARYGSSVVPGGLELYGLNAPTAREELGRQFLLEHPDFLTPGKRMTIRDTQFNPYSSGGIYGGGAGGMKPMDLANFRLNYMKGVLGPGGTGLFATPFAERAAQAESLGTSLGLSPLLKGDLTPPTTTVGGVKSPKPNQVDPREQKMLDMINGDTGDPAALSKEFENDVKANPAAFKGINLEKLRAAIRNKKKPVVRPKAATRPGGRK